MLDDLRALGRRRAKKRRVVTRPVLFLMIDEHWKGDPIGPTDEEQAQVFSAASDWVWLRKRRKSPEERLRAIEDLYLQRWTTQHGPERARAMLDFADCFSRNGDVEVPVPWTIRCLLVLGAVVALLGLLQAFGVIR